MSATNVTKTEYTVVCAGCGKQERVYNSYDKPRGWLTVTAKVTAHGDFSHPRRKAKVKADVCGLACLGAFFVQETLPALARCRDVTVNS